MEKRRSNPLQTAFFGFIFWGLVLTGACVSWALALKIAAGLIAALVLNYAVQNAIRNLRNASRNEHNAYRNPITRFRTWK